MSLIQDAKEIKTRLNELCVKTNTQQKRYFSVIDGMVKLHQKHRLAKNYQVSDEIRQVLNDCGIKIIQGTAQYKSYADIPDHLKNMTGDDQWRIE